MNIKPKRGTPGTKPGVTKPLARPMDSDAFADRLKKAMRGSEKFSTVPELAGEVVCTRAVLSKYLNRNAKSVDPILLFKIADVLGVSPRWLLLGEGEMNPGPALSPDQTEALRVLAQLTTPAARETWLSSGTGLVKFHETVLNSIDDPHLSVLKKKVHS